jgi:hypothetical protein
MAHGATLMAHQTTTACSTIACLRYSFWSLSEENSNYSGTKGNLYRKII